MPRKSPAPGEKAKGRRLAAVNDKPSEVREEPARFFLEPKHRAWLKQKKLEEGFTESAFVRAMFDRAMAVDERLGGHELLEYFAAWVLKIYSEVEEPMTPKDFALMIKKFYRHLHKRATPKVGSDEE